MRRASFVGGSTSVTLVSAWKAEDDKQRLTKEMPTTSLVEPHIELKLMLIEKSPARSGIGDNEDNRAGGAEMEMETTSASSRASTGGSGAQEGRPGAAYERVDVGSVDAEGVARQMVWCFWVSSELGRQRDKGTYIRMHMKPMMSCAMRRFSEDRWLSMPTLALSQTA